MTVQYYDVSLKEKQFINNANKDFISIFNIDLGAQYQ